MPEDDEAYKLNILDYGSLIQEVLIDISEDDKNLELLDKKIDIACKRGTMPYGVFLDKQKEDLQNTLHFIIKTLQEKNIALTYEKKGFALEPFTLQVENTQYKICLKGEVPLMNAVFNSYINEISPKRLIKALLIGLIQKEIALPYDSIYVINQKSVSKLPLINDSFSRLSLIKEAVSIYIKGLLRPQIGGDTCLPKKKPKEINKKIEDLNNDPSCISSFLEFEAYSDEQRYMFADEELALQANPLIQADFRDFMHFYFSHILNVLDK